MPNPSVALCKAKPTTRIVASPMAPDAALALSLAKRARELLLGLPGLFYMHLAARGSASAAGTIP